MTNSLRRWGPNDRIFLSHAVFPNGISLITDFTRLQNWKWLKMVPWRFLMLVFFNTPVAESWDFSAKIIISLWIHICKIILTQCLFIFGRNLKRFIVLLFLFGVALVSSLNVSQRFAMLFQIQLIVNFNHNWKNKRWRARSFPSVLKKHPHREQQTALYNHDVHSCATMILVFQTKNDYYYDY